MNESFDITTLTPAETAFCHLKHPVDEEPLFVGEGDAKGAVGITYSPPGSARYEMAEKNRTNRALFRSRKKIEVTADILRTDTVKFMADITISFDNLAYPPAGDATGEKLFTALFADRQYRWAHEQFSTHLADLGNSIKKSATS
jgi:hypothetical protein